MEAIKKNKVVESAKSSEAKATAKNITSSIPAIPTVENSTLSKYFKAKTFTDKSGDTTIEYTIKYTSAFGTLSDAFNNNKAIPNEFIKNSHSLSKYDVLLSDLYALLTSYKAVNLDGKTIENCLDVINKVFSIFADIDIESFDSDKNSIAKNEIKGIPCYKYDFTALLNKAMPVKKGKCTGLDKFTPVSYNTFRKNAEKYFYSRIVTYFIGAKETSFFNESLRENYANNACRLIKNAANRIFAGKVKNENALRTLKAKILPDVKAADCYKLEEIFESLDIEKFKKYNEVERFEFFSSLDKAVRETLTYSA